MRTFKGSMEMIEKGSLFFNVKQNMVACKLEVCFFFLKAHGDC